MNPVTPGPSIIRYRRNYSVQWAEKNPILKAGEPGYDIDQQFFKVGNGFQHWLDLPKYLTEAEMLVAVQEAVAAAYSELYDTKPILLKVSTDPVALTKNAVQPFDVASQLVNTALPDLATVSVNDTYWIQNLSDQTIVQPLASGDHTSGGNSSIFVYEYQTTEIVCAADPYGTGKVWTVLSVNSSADPKKLDQHVERAFTTAANVWNWEHNLGFTPAATVMNSNREVVAATVMENGPTRTVVSFYFPFAGILALS